MRPEFIHKIFSTLLQATEYPVKYKSVTNNGDGTFTLNEVCDFHHAQPGATVTIDGFSYVIISYDNEAGELVVSGTDAISVLSFNLYKPFLFHGTPVEQQNELNKIPDIILKTPMIYLMEPYKIEYDFDPGSSIAMKVDCTLAFLTQADMQNWLTDDFYYNAITPMKNLFEDFIKILTASNLFKTIDLKAGVKFFPKFGIQLKQFGTEKLLFSEGLSGISADFTLEVYKLDSCECEIILNKYLMLPYKVYSATLSQTGASNPVANILQNTLGDIVWTRDQPGNYIATLAGAFLLNRTWVYIAQSEDVATESNTGVVRLSANQLLFTTGGFVSQNYLDGILSDTSVEIRVY